MNWDDFGAAAFAAYREVYGENELFPWEHLHPQEKAAWTAAARRAISRFCGVAMAQFAGELQDLTPVDFAGRVDRARRESEEFDKIVTPRRKL